MKLLKVLCYSQVAKEKSQFGNIMLKEKSRKKYKKLSKKQNDLVIFITSGCEKKQKEAYKIWFKLNKKMIKMIKS